MSALEELTKIWKLLSGSKNIPILITSMSISTIGVGFLIPYLPIFLRDKGISLVELGGIISLAGFGSIIVKPIAGYVSDRFGRKIIITLSFFLQAILTPLYLFINNVLGLGLVQLSRNIASESSQPAVSAMIGDVAPKEGRATLFGLYSAIGSIVYASALIGSGMLLAWGITISDLFYIAAGGLLISAVLLLLFLKETAPAREKQRAVEKSEETRKESFLKAFAERNSLGLLLYTFFFMSALAVYSVYISLFVVETFGGAEELVGPITAISWITFAVVQPLGGWISDSLGTRKIPIGIGLILIIIFNTLMAVSPTLVWMVVFWALIGVGDGMFRPVMSALIVDVVPSEKRGTYFGTIGVMRGGANVVAPLLYGFVAELYGIRWTFHITSIFFVLCIVVIFVLIREKKEPGAAA